MLTVGTNSYLTVDEANAYFADRVDAAAWTSADVPLKEQALVTASRMLNELIWVGVASADTQKLAFPRIGEYLEPILGKVVQLDSAVVPDRIKAATCEQAYQLLNNDGLLDDTGTVSKLKVDVIELEGLDSSAAQAPRFSSTAESYYYPLTADGCDSLMRKYSGSGNNTWWRAN